MPKLSPKLKKIRDTNFITALVETGNLAVAAKRVGKIGSQGATDIENSAASMGSQRLKNLNLSLLDAYINKGITPEKLANTNFELLEDEKPEVRLKALDTGIKVGVGGGYAAEKHESINLNVNTTPDDVTKYEGLRKKYTEELLKTLAHGKE